MYGLTNKQVAVYQSFSALEPCNSGLFWSTNDWNWKRYHFLRSNEDVLF